jgi:hypothetical protein
MPLLQQVLQVVAAVAAKVLTEPEITLLTALQTQAVEVAAALPLIAPVHQTARPVALV